MKPTISPAQITEYDTFLNQLAEEAAAITLPLFKQPIAVINKGPKRQLDFDPVTKADQQAEENIHRMIHKTYPNHNIFGEEMGLKNYHTPAGRDDENPVWTWVVDPIDGTRAYICGIPTWGTLVALNADGVPLFGLMDQPYLKERFIGTPKGAYLNGKPIRCRACDSLSEATISTTDPIQHLESGAEQDAFGRVAGQARLVRNGYDCYAYAMVAAGFMDVVIESGLAPYDIQALIPIVEGAGGIVTDWTGGPAAQGGQVVAAATQTLHQQVLEQLNWS